jgi:hypothetical protein
MPTPKTKPVKASELTPMLWRQLDALELFYVVDLIKRAFVTGCGRRALARVVFVWVWAGAWARAFTRAV